MGELLIPKSVEEVVEILGQETIITIPEIGKIADVGAIEVPTLSAEDKEYMQWLQLLSLEAPDKLLTVEPPFVGSFVVSLSGATHYIYKSPERLRQNG